MVFRVSTRVGNVLEKTGRPIHARSQIQARSSIQVRCAILSGGFLSLYETVLFLFVA